MLIDGYETVIVLSHQCPSFRVGKDTATPAIKLTPNKCPSKIDVTSLLETGKSGMSFSFLGKKRM